MRWVFRLRDIGTASLCHPNTGTQSTGSWNPEVPMTRRIKISVLAAQSASEEPNRWHFPTLAYLPSREVESTRQCPREQAANAR
jgi:hypothetical protein